VLRPAAGTPATPASRTAAAADAGGGCFVHTISVHTISEILMFCRIRCLWRGRPGLGRCCKGAKRVSCGDGLCSNGTIQNRVRLDYLQVQVKTQHQQEDLRPQWLWCSVVSSWSGANDQISNFLSSQLDSRAN